MKKRIISILLACFLLCPLLPMTAAAVPTGGGLPFDDVAEADWFYDGVQYVFENDLMVGTGGETFDPSATTTRAMLVTILYRQDGMPVVHGRGTFRDVAEDAWYTDAVEWAADGHIVNGYGNGLFGPGDTITREQAAAILFRYAEYKGYDVSERSDLSVFDDAGEAGAWAETALSWANAERLITGAADRLLNPKGEATRTQVAVILQRFCERFAPGTGTEPMPAPSAAPEPTSAPETPAPADEPVVEKGTGLSEEEASGLTFADISETDWETFEQSNTELSRIVAQYSDESGYIPSDRKPDAIDAVAAKVDEMYQEGTVSCYCRDGEGVSFEYASGLRALYAPAIEGYDSGSGEATIYTFDPFESEKDNDDSAKQTGQHVYTALRGADIHTYENQSVSLLQLQNLQESDVFLWHGHGNYYKRAVTRGGESYPVLVTGEEATQEAVNRLLSTSVNEMLASVGTVEYWAITPHFVEEHISMRRGLAYLAACHSGHGDFLANAFRDSGAETVFINAGTVSVNRQYDVEMMEQIVGLMSARYDGVCYTAGEALERANRTLSDRHKNGIAVGKRLYKNLEEFIREEQGGTHVEIRGEENYTLCSCIRGRIECDESVSEDTRENLFRTLSVRLEDSNGELLRTASVEGGTFNFNNLDPGTCYVLLLRDGKTVAGNGPVEVKAHRYSSVSLSVEVPEVYEVYGTVRDRETLEPVGAYVSLLQNGTEVSGAVAQTDAEGRFHLEDILPGSYTLHVTPMLTIVDKYEPLDYALTLEETQVRTIFTLPEELLLTPTADKAVVRFDPGQGSGRMESVKAVAGTTIRLPACGFTGPEDAPVFAGWSDGSSELLQPNSEYCVPEGGGVLTACWQAGEKEDPEEDDPEVLNSEAGHNPESDTEEQLRTGLYFLVYDEEEFEYIDDWKNAGKLKGVVTWVTWGHTSGRILSIIDIISADSVKNSEDYRRACELTPLPDVRIKLVGDGRSYIGVTDENGFCYFPNVVSGEYNILINKEGYNGYPDNYGEKFLKYYRTREIQSGQIITVGLTQKWE